MCEVTAMLGAGRTGRDRDKHNNRSATNLGSGSVPRSSMTDDELLKQQNLLL